MLGTALFSAALVSAGRYLGSLCGCVDILFALVSEAGCK